MTRNCKNMIGIVMLTVVFMAGVGVKADLASWNAEITAANPLNWYKFDEASGSDCIDSGSDGLNGVYTSVTLAQDGAFGEGSAVLFDPTADSVVRFGDIPPLSGDYTAEYIVKKLGTGSQALHDSDVASIRLEGAGTNNVSFTLYTVLDYYFTIESDESAEAPVGQWIHLVFRRNSEGTQAFINGTLVGTHTASVDCPRVRIGIREGTTNSDKLNAVLDEAIVYDRALSDEEIVSHAFAGVPDFIPDYFERYPDTTALALLWPGDAFITLETTEVYEGSQAMKAEFSASGTITKNLNRTDSYSAHAGQDFLVMLKGDSGNAAGDVTVSVMDPNGVTTLSMTYTNGTQATEWVELMGTVPGREDPNEAWTDISSIQIDVGAAATMYFDNIEIRIPPHTPVKVVEWLFDDGKGITADDNTGHGFDGSVNLGNNGWVIDGGNTGETGDHAVLFDKANESVTALNVTLPDTVDDIFKGDSSWTINLWINIIDNANAAMIGGFGDCDFVDGDAYSDRYLNLWTEGSIEFNYGDWGVWPGTEPTPDEWHMLTATYNKWSTEIKMYLDGELITTRTPYNNTDPDTYVPTATPWLVDVPQRAFKLGDVGTVAWTTEEDDPQVPLMAMIDDFCIWDGDLPWMDDDPETDDVLSLYGTWICYEPPVYDIDGDCQVNVSDLAELISAWLESGRYPADL